MNYFACNMAETLAIVPSSPQRKEAAASPRAKSSLSSEWPLLGEALLQSGLSLPEDWAFLDTASAQQQMHEALAAAGLPMELNNSLVVGVADLQLQMQERMRQLSGQFPDVGERLNDVGERLGLQEFSDSLGLQELQESVRQTLSGQLPAPGELLGTSFGLVESGSSPHTVLPPGLPQIPLPQLAALQISGTAGMPSPLPSRLLEGHSGGVKARRRSGLLEFVL